MNLIALHYKIKKKIYEGDLEVVYLIEDIATQEIFTIKIFDKIPIKDIREKLDPKVLFEIIKISHPNLVKIFDYGIENNRFYFLSEYCYSKGIQNLNLKNKNDFLQIILQSCYALDHLHKNKILHKDLKLENVMYQFEDDKIKIKICDFGFNKIIPDVDNYTEDAKTNLPYLAPEILQGGSFSRKSDFYALGIILYYIAVGNFPFSNEEIKLMSYGKTQKIIPQFPSQINPIIDKDLEDLIFRLIDFNPTQRLSSGESIIEILNKTQNTNFKISTEPSIIHQIHTKHFLLRDEDIMGIKTYVDDVMAGKGSTILITSDIGVGKREFMQYMKWYLLSKDSLVYYYNCSENHKDPFFMLTKQIFISQEEKGKERFRKLGSEKLSEFLFKSEEQAINITEDSKSLKKDFNLTRDYIYDFAEKKPIIFFISNIELTDKSTIEFVEFLSKDIQNHPILIVIGTYDKKLSDKIKNSSTLPILLLSKDETFRYLQDLLETNNISKEFNKKIFYLTSGNQIFIRNILSSAIQNKDIIKKNNTWILTINPDKIKLPPTIHKIIKIKLDRIPKILRKKLSELSVLEVPLSREIMKYVLEIKTLKELFFFLEECKLYDLLIIHEDFKKEGYYKFIYPSLKKSLEKEVSIKKRNFISKKVTEYFLSKEIENISIINGIIKHSKEISDYKVTFYYLMKKTESYLKQNLYNDAWISNLQAIVYFNKIPKSIIKSKIRYCLKTFLFLSVILKKCLYKRSILDKSIKIFSQDFEIQLLNAKILLNCSKFKECKEKIEKIDKLANPQQKNSLLILKLSYYTICKNFEKAKIIAQNINIKNLSTKQKISFLYQKANYYYASGNYDQTIKDLQIAKKITKKEKDYFNLARILKIIADTYNQKNLINKAITTYKEAVNISREQGDLLTLGNVYSHCGFLHFKKGELKISIDRLNLGLKYFKTINNLKGMSEIYLNLALTYHKMGEFQKSDLYFQKSLKLAIDLNDVNLVDIIKAKYSFLKLKTSLPYKFLNFLKKNYKDYFQYGKITRINSFLKNYTFLLKWCGRYDKIDEIIKQIEKQNIDCTIEKEYVNQLIGISRLAKKRYTSAIKYFQRTVRLTQKNKNEYGLMIAYFNLAETYYEYSKFLKAEIYCDYAKSIALNNHFSRWLTFAKVLKTKIILQNPQKNLRPLLRILLDCHNKAQETQDWVIELQTLLLLTLIYKRLNIKINEKRYKNKFSKALASVTKNLNKKNTESTKEKFYFDRIDSKKTLNKFVPARIHISNLKLQHYFIDLLQLTDLNQIKYKIKKGFSDVIGIDDYAIIKYDERTGVKKIWQNNALTREELSSILGSRTNEIQNNLKPYYFNENNKHYCIAPLSLKNEILGMVIFHDGGEMPYKTHEKLIIKLSAFYLAIIIKKIGEYQQILEQRENLSKLLNISRDILQIMDLEQLKLQITTNAITLSNAERGFFITLDENKNFLFDIALLKSDEKIERDELKINYNVIRNVYESGKSLIKINTSLRDGIHTPFFDENNPYYSIYCTPLMVHNKLFGLLYLDTCGDHQKNFIFDEKLLEVFKLTCETSIKNYLDYEKLRKANEELLNLDNEKTQFINISSHEFNTPIQILKGYIKILKDKNISKDERFNTIRVMENNINRLSHAINNILQRDSLNKVANITKEKLDVRDILKIVYDEVKILAQKRKQKIILKISKEVYYVLAEKISLINSIKNLVLNAIKFTEDYGEIILGVRKSILKKEEVDNKKSVVIYVKDNGIGIPSYELGNIFKEFYEVAEIKSHHSGITEFKSSGLGLGLPITKSIVQLFGGKIWAKSTKGKGSVFFIALPFAKNSKSD